MALDTDALKDLLRRELGKSTDAEFSSLVDAWFELNSGKSSRLQYLYSKRSAIQYLNTQQSGSDYDIKEGDVEYKRSQGKTYLDMLKDLDKDISAAEMRSGAGSVTPVSNLPNSINPSDSTFYDDVASLNEYGRARC